MFASEYGYTWEQFVSMTYKQVNSQMEAMHERRYNNVAMQAALRGVKMEPYRKTEKITEEDEKRANAVRDELIRRNLDGRKARTSN